LIKARFSKLPGIPIKSIDVINDIQTNEFKGYVFLDIDTALLNIKEPVASNSTNSKVIDPITKVLNSLNGLQWFGKKLIVERAREDYKAHHERSKQREKLEKESVEKEKLEKVKKSSDINQVSTTLPSEFRVRKVRGTPALVVPSSPLEISPSSESLDYNILPETRSRPVRVKFSSTTQAPGFRPDWSELPEAYTSLAMHQAAVLLEQAMEHHNPDVDPSTESQSEAEDLDEESRVRGRDLKAFSDSESEEEEDEEEVKEEEEEEEEEDDNEVSDESSIRYHLSEDELQALTANPLSTAPMIEAVADEPADFEVVKADAGTKIARKKESKPASSSQIAVENKTAIDIFEKLFPPSRETHAPPKAKPTKKQAVAPKPAPVPAPVSGKKLSPTTSSTGTSVSHSAPAEASTKEVTPSPAPAPAPDLSADTFVINRAGTASTEIKVSSLRSVVYGDKAKKTKKQTNDEDGMLMPVKHTIAPFVETAFRVSSMFESVDVDEVNHARNDQITQDTESRKRARSIDEPKVSFPQKKSFQDAESKNAPVPSSSTTSRNEHNQQNSNFKNDKKVSFPPSQHSQPQQKEWQKSSSAHSSQRPHKFHNSAKPLPQIQAPKSKADLFKLATSFWSAPSTDANTGKQGKK
jgi:hypothetical protein